MEIVLPNSFHGKGADMKRKEIRALTGLRGVAAVMVMIYHFQVIPQVPLWGLPSVGPGYLMVDLFFVLSGFVMARTYGASFNKGLSRDPYIAFLEARFARVYPLYALICITIFVLTKAHLTTSASFPIRALISNMPMLENLGFGSVGPGFAEYLDPPSWSISTELGAYLLFPVLAMLALHQSRRTACLVAIISMGVVVWLSIMPHSWRHLPYAHDPLNISSGETLWPLARCLAEFFLGLVTFRVAERLHTRTRRIWVDVLILTALVAAWLIPEGDILIVGLFPIIILQVCEDDSWLAHLLGTSIPYRLGEWSYAIYLLHWPALDLIRFTKPKLTHAHIIHAHEVSLALIFLIVIATAALAHNIIERPARTMLRSQFTRRIQPIRFEPRIVPRSVV